MKRVEMEVNDDGKVTIKVEGLRAWEVLGLACDLQIWAADEARIRQQVTDERKETDDE